jgi:tetratricopeptide (TPR) repeat protein
MFNKRCLGYWQASATTWSFSFLQNLQKRQPLSPEGLRALGLAYERTNKLADARRTLEDSATRKLSVAALLEVARVAHEQKDFKGSLGYLAHARDLDPGSARLHYYFGLVCLDLDLVAEARNSLEKAVKLEPENPSYKLRNGNSFQFPARSRGSRPFL